MSQKYGISVRQVSRILRAGAEQVRADTAGIVAEQFHLQLARLERLYSIVEMEIQAYEEYMIAVREARAAGTNITPVKFDERPFRVAVLIMDRQAKLLGLDRGGIGPSDRSPTRWLDEAPIEEVVSYAKQLKMNLPTEFRT